MEQKTRFLLLFISCLQRQKNDYRDNLEDKIRVNKHSLETSTEDNWTTVKLSITAAGESVGRGRRNQPKWFEENTEVLTPLIVAKKRLILQISQITPKLRKKSLENIKEL